MVAKIGDFVGEYTITQVGATEPVLRSGMKLLVGTNPDLAPPPVLTDGYFLVVGFALLDESGNPVLSTADAQQQPLVLLYDEGTLRWAGYYGGKPLRIFLSLCQTGGPGGMPYKAVYGTTLLGDPDQVGVWGADGNAPSGP